MPKEHDEVDHLRYTKEQIAKNLILLEEHFKNYPCAECIEKHLLSVVGYSEEGLGMNGEEIFTKAKRWGQETRKELKRKGATEARLLDLASAARDLRRIIQEGAHISETQVKEVLKLKHHDEMEEATRMAMRHG